MSTHVVPHHFRNAEEAFQSSKLGLWLFLVTEVLMFGGLFVGYTILKSANHEMFTAASQYLDATLGGANTVILLLSSLTVALAVNRIQLNQSKLAGHLLVFSFLCGAAFMVIKYFEYSHKIHLGLLPGGLFDYPELSNVHPKAPLYFSLYFMMTGLHGSHVLVGMGLLLWCAIRCYRGDFDSSYFTPVELSGLFWHLVDLIWIYLFPLMYLVP